MNNNVVPSAEDECIAAEEASGLAAAVAGLPADLRDIYTLWSTGEWGQEELAREFGLSRGVIRARIERIKQYLVERVDSDTAFAVGLIGPERAL